MNALKNWIVDESKIFSQSEKHRLRKIAKSIAETAKSQKKTAIRDWLIVDLALATGLRVMEIASLDCGDIYLGQRPYLIVRRGKGGKQRMVRFGQNLKNHLIEYMQWKEANNESIETTAPLLLSSNTDKHLTIRAIQKSFGRSLAKAKIKDHSIHHCRHSYATNMLEASGNNLRLVQRQLGHAKITTTQVYTHVSDKTMDKAVKKFDEI